MPKNLVDVDAFGTVAVPVDTDPRNAASVETPFQEIANRTRYLRNELEDSIDAVSNEFIYPAPGKLRTVHISPRRMRPDTAANWTLSGAPIDGWITTVSAAGALRLDLGRVLPTACIMASIQAVVKPAAARGLGSRVNLRMLKYTSDFVGPSASTVVSNTAEDDGTTDLQVVSLSLATAALQTPDFATGSHVLALNGGTGTLGDVVHALRLSFFDPGPRNF